MSWHFLIGALVAALALLGSLDSALRGHGGQTALPAALPGGAEASRSVVSADAAPAEPETIAASNGVQLFGPRLATLGEAEQARRNGDYAGAVSVLRLLAVQSDPASANDAQLLLAVVLTEAGRLDEAADAARALLDRQIDSRTRGRAMVVLGRAQRLAGNCPSALETFREAERVGTELGEYLDLQMAECHARLNDRDSQTERSTKAAGLATVRLTKVDALEYVVDAALKRGDNEAALRASHDLLAHAGTRAYRAQTLTSIGNINAELGRRDAAVQAYATVVSDLWETPTAAGSLDGLARLGGLAAVGPDQVGVVQHFQGRHGDAVASLTDGLDQGIGGDRAARATYYRGISLIRLGRLDDGVASLVQVATLTPDASLAPAGLFRAGRALESYGRLAEAGDLYRRAADAYPASPEGQEALQRLVVVLYLRGAVPEAVAAGRELPARQAEARWVGLGLFWAGKGFARAGDQPQAQEAWRQAADLAPDDFGGLRAAAVLNGDTRATHTTRTIDPAVVRPTDADRAELESWLKTRGVDRQTLTAEQMANRHYARASELIAVGMREQARWELQELSTQFANDPVRLIWLASVASEYGEIQLSIRFAVEARRSTNAPLSAQPKLVQRLIYPLPFADLIVGQAQRRGVDPLLFAALVRQESSFNPAARSSANAIGLAQVVPPTGQEIARALGRSDYTTNDLLRPVVSVEFGMYYLATQLQTYGNLVYPALAAYNAGGGNVNGWIREYGTDDLDLFAEKIPFAETNYYVRVVYENYRIYRRLYGG